METATETARLVGALRALTWNASAPEYHATLPPGDSLSDDFFVSVAMINMLAIAAVRVYTALPARSDARRFMDYFMSAAHASESFIWGQRGLIQSYFDAGLAWQRGGAADPRLDPRSTELPTLSSAAADCLIGRELLAMRDDGAALWWGAEQQNHATDRLFGTRWCWAVPTDSNPPVFAPRAPRPAPARRLVLGPATWLALAQDVLNWRNAPAAASARFRDAQRRGRWLWRTTARYARVNAHLLRMALRRLRPTIAVRLRALHTMLEKDADAIRWPLHPQAAHGPRLTARKAERTLRAMRDALWRAAASGGASAAYTHHVQSAVRELQQFYCASSDRCVFVAPALAPANDEPDRITRIKHLHLE